MANTSQVIRWGFANGGNTSLFDYNQFNITPGNYNNCSGSSSSSSNTSSGINVDNFLPSDLAFIITGTLTGIQDGPILPLTGVQNLNGFSIC